MAFKESDAQRLLAECHRRCCICHRYCGVRMEIDHIDPKVSGGPDTYGNAIAVCFDCHAEIHHYNPKHPRGRRFHLKELEYHRDQWLNFCKSNPAALAGAVPSAEGGALERLLNELLFNKRIAETNRPGAIFEIAQFRRAIADGTFAWLKPEQVTAVSNAYVLISEINNRVRGSTSIEHPTRRMQAANEAKPLLPKAVVAIENALNALEENL